MTWIAEFFQNAFWQRVDSASDLQETLAPMEIGQYFRIGEEGNMQPAKLPKRLPKGYRRVSVGWNIAKLITKPKARKGPKKGVTRGQGRT